MKWTVPVPLLFVRFARSAGKPIAWLSELTEGLRTPPLPALSREPQQNARRHSRFHFCEELRRWRDYDVG